MAELQDAFHAAHYAVQRFAVELLFWNNLRSAVISLVCGAWWQLLVSRPELLPSSIPIFFLAILADNYAHKQWQPRYSIHMPLAVPQLVWTLLTGRAPRPLHADAVGGSELRGSAGRSGLPSHLEWWDRQPAATAKAWTSASRSFVEWWMPSAARGSCSGVGQADDAGVSKPRDEDESDDDELEREEFMHRGEEGSLFAKLAEMEEEVRLKHQQYSLSCLFSRLPLLILIFCDCDLSPSCT